MKIRIAQGRNTPLSDLRLYFPDILLEFIETLPKPIYLDCVTEKNDKYGSVPGV